ncbi:MAG TPA: hypothetical protein VHS96_16755, partial [Bacteroidia bacterium]|nr:hypothetical protein [Bacteroidia bacterium]
MRLSAIDGDEAIQVHTNRHFGIVDRCRAQLRFVILPPSHGSAVCANSEAGVVADTDLLAQQCLRVGKSQKQQSCPQDGFAPIHFLK